MRARPWRESVRMPACGPVSVIAGTPSAWSAMATSVPLMCSPVASSRSISRGSGSSVIRAASSMRSSVVSPMALTTTTSRSPVGALARDAPRDVPDAVGVASDEPPYFWTMSMARF